MTIFSIKQIPSVCNLNQGLIRERYDSQAYFQNTALTKQEIAIYKNLIPSNHETEMCFTYTDKKLDISFLLW